MLSNCHVSYCQHRLVKLSFPILTKDIYPRWERCNKDPRLNQPLDTCRIFCCHATKTTFPRWTTFCFQYVRNLNAAKSAWSKAGERSGVSVLVFIFSVITFSSFESFFYLCLSYCAVKFDRANWFQGLILRFVGRFFIILRVGPSTRHQKLPHPTERDNRPTRGNNFYTGS